jgi:hypothetical protein
LLDFHAGIRLAEWQCMEQFIPSDETGPALELTPSPESTAAPEPATPPPVQVLADAVRIGDLTIDRKVIVEYLQGIAPAKQTIALVHALEVGVTELHARRERFDRH